MDESRAWLLQAKADRLAAERFAGDEAEIGSCHAIAKWQQAVEKSIKALVAALYETGLLTNSFQTKHDVARYINVLVRLPGVRAHHAIQRQLYGLLDQPTRVGIAVLDGLAPRLPTRRNTEYPFPDAQGRWTYPAAEGVNSPAEMQQFRDLTHRVLNGSDRVVSASRRRTR